MLLRDRDDSLELWQLRRRGRDRGVGSRLASFLDEVLHSRRRLNHEGSGRGASAGAMRVDHTLWKVNERSGAGRKCLVAQREVEGSLENIKALVAVAMDVRRWTELGSRRELCHCKRTVGVVADDLEGEQVASSG